MKVAGHQKALGTRISFLFLSSGNSWSPNRTHALRETDAIECITMAHLRMVITCKNATIKKCHI